MTTVNLNLFGENEDLYEVVSIIRNEQDFQGVTNIKEKFTGNSGWYNHYNLTFDYEGKRYTISYKKHTSDNISDFEYVSELLCLGESVELEEVITKEDLVRSEMYYKEHLDMLNKEIKELKKKEKLLKSVRLSHNQLFDLSRAFSSEHPERDRKPLELEIGKLFYSLGEMKRKGEL